MNNKATNTTVPTHDAHGRTPVGQQTAVTDMVNDSTNTIKTQLRYHMYSIRLNIYFRPGIPLDKRVNHYKTRLVHSFSKYAYGTTSIIYIF